MNEKGRMRIGKREQDRGQLSPRLFSWTADYRILRSKTNTIQTLLDDKDQDWLLYMMPHIVQALACAQTHVLQLFEASSRLDVEGTQARSTTWKLGLVTIVG